MKSVNLNTREKNDSKLWQSFFEIIDKLHTVLIHLLRTRYLLPNVMSKRLVNESKNCCFFEVLFVFQVELKPVVLGNAHCLLLLLGE